MQKLSARRRIDSGSWMVHYFCEGGSLRLHCCTEFYGRQLNDDGPIIFYTMGRSKRIRRSQSSSDFYCESIRPVRRHSPYERKSDIPWFFIAAHDAGRKGPALITQAFLTASSKKLEVPAPHESLLHDQLPERVTVKFSNKRFWSPATRIFKKDEFTNVMVRAVLNESESKLKDVPS